MYADHSPSKTKTMSRRPSSTSISNWMRWAVDCAENGKTAALLSPRTRISKTSKALRRTRSTPTACDPRTFGVSPAYINITSTIKMKKNSAADFRSLTANIRLVLTERAQASIGDVLARYPAVQGLGSVVGYLALGSRDNISDFKPGAQVFKINADGSMSEFASGLRNPVGIAVYPGTNTLYVTTNERDGLGDDLPPDYLTSVRPGGFYGYPYAYIGKNPDPVWGAKVREAVEIDLALAREKGFAYVEIGGWALTEEWRSTRAALEILVGSYALAHLWGGCLGACTATARHGSSSMLRRIGGSPLRVPRTAPRWPFRSTSSIHAPV